MCKISKESVIDQLKEVRDSLNAARSHACVGWDCAICNPIGLAEKVSDCINKLKIVISTIEKIEARAAKIADGLPHGFPEQQQ